MYLYPDFIVFKLRPGIVRSLAGDGIQPPALPLGYRTVLCYSSERISYKNLFFKMEVWYDAPTMAKKKTFAIIDGNAIIHRAYHAFRR